MIGNDIYKIVNIYRDNINTLHKDKVTTLTINHRFEKYLNFNNKHLKMPVLVIENINYINHYKKQLP